MRLLWLVYERPGHPDAVVYPIDADVAEFVISLLRQPYERRIHLTGQLIRYLARYQQHPLGDRPAVPCRMPSGLYHLVPWRLAKWLRHVLPAPDSSLDRAIRRVEQWRNADVKTHTLAVQ